MSNRFEWSSQDLASLAWGDQDLTLLLTEAQVRLLIDATVVPVLEQLRAAVPEMYSKVDLDEKIKEATQPLANMIEELWQRPAIVNEIHVPGKK